MQGFRALPGSSARKRIPSRTNLHKHAIVPPSYKSPLAHIGLMPQNHPDIFKKVGAMDQYLPISILSTRAEASDACGLLEDAGIPIMLQYLEVEEDGEKVCAYRLLVPMEFTQASIAILGGVSETEQQGEDLSVRAA